jgi:KDO2-lipid IV(A) lauroyltransferase
VTDERDDAEPSEEAVGEFHALPGLRTDWPVPRVGVYGTRSGPMARLEAALFRGTIELVARLPHGAREAFVGAVARVARAFDRRHSAAAREFLLQALGAEAAPRADRLVLEAWKHMLRVMLDARAYLLRYPAERLLDRVELVLCEDVKKLIAQKRGAIVISGHIGDWETGAALAPLLGFDPFYGIGKPARNRPLSVHVQALREARGLRTLPRRGAMQHAPAVLRAGGSLGMLLDQRARKRPVMAPFFGRMARCDRSAGVLLKRLRAPLVILGCYRKAEPLTWRCEVPTVLWPEQVAELSVEELVGVVNRELEQLILRAPEQYFWLHERYRGASETVPPAATATAGR